MRYHQHLIPDDVLAHLLPPGCTPEQVLPGLRRRAYSVVKFLELIGHCYGVDYLLKKWMDEEKRITVFFSPHGKEKRKLYM